MGNANDLRQPSPLGQPLSTDEPDTPVVVDLVTPEGSSDQSLASLGLTPPKPTTASARARGRSGSADARLRRHEQTCMLRYRPPAYRANSSKEYSAQREYAPGTPGATPEQRLLALEQQRATDQHMFDSYADAIRNLQEHV